MNKLRTYNLATLLNMVLAVFANIVIQEEEINGTQIGKDKIKLVSLVSDNLSVYVEHTKESIHTENTPSKLVN